MTTRAESASASSEDDFDDDNVARGAAWQAQTSEPSTTSQTKSSTAKKGSTTGEDPESSPPSEEPAIPLQKRRRVNRACDECRRKKIKCNGKQPCVHCTVYTYECTYNQPSNRKRTPGPQYVETLEVKLLRAEAILKSVYPAVDLDDPTLDERLAIDSEAIRNSRKADKRRSAARSSLNGLQNGPDGEKDSMLESMVQDTGSLDLDDDGHWDFYGHSSSRAFLRKMREQFGDLIGMAEPVGMSQQASREQQPQLLSPSSSSVNSPRFSGMPSTSELPTKECAINLCRNALDDACAILRFVHQPTFYAMVDRVYDRRPEDLGSEELKFIPLLYSTLALGSLFATDEESELQSHGLENAIDQGTHWFRATRSMIDISECRDLTSLQCMLFMILFLQSSSRLSACYSHLGIALRSAIRIGLHRSLPNVFNPLEQELRKRIFWCIQKLDIYVGVLLGFPTMLTNEDIDQEYPLEVDDEYITTERIIPMPAGKPSLMAAFNAHTRVVEILKKTVKYIYPINGPKSQSSHSYIVSHARIREIEHDLEQWQEQLPEAFRSGGQAPREFLRIQHLLRMAYGHLQLMLYRPFLHYASPDTHTKAFNQRSYACAAACVSVSRNLVHLTGEMKRVGLLVGSYWFYMYTTFFAVISLVFYVLENPQNSTSAEILRDAHEGKDTLASLAKRSLAAARCSRTLTDLFEQLPERLKGARMNSGSQKKRRAPSKLPVAQPQMLQSAPEMQQPSKPDPNPTFSRSYTAPAPKNPWTEPPGSQAQIPQTFQRSYYQGPQDQTRPINQSHPNAADDSASTVPSIPYSVQQVTTGVGVPDLSAMMFPSEDPFVYPNQPITTLENRQNIKQEETEGMYGVQPAAVSTNAPYEDVDGRHFGGMPAYSVPNQQVGFQMAGVSGMNPSHNSIQTPAPEWIQHAPDQDIGGPPATPLDQLFGEDWSGWINQGYRQV